jgi:hypothetical protein
MFLLILAAAVAGGAALATLAEPRDPLWTRLAVGAALGVAVQSLAGFIAASWLGLTPALAWGAAAVCLAVPLSLTRRARHTDIPRAASPAPGPSVAPPSGGTAPS